MEHLGLEVLEAGLGEIRRSPRDAGTVELIVRRPAQGEREVLAVAELDPVAGLVGDNWRARGSTATADGPTYRNSPITLMNARVAALVAQSRERWALAGDQLYVDLDLSGASLPPGTRLEVGTAVIEVIEEPHLGCGKFLRRFGVDAMKFVNSGVGRELNLRGLNARVATAGTVGSGDPIRRR
jgi:hypothetical protein